jgi:hypothetical protein
VYISCVGRMGFNCKAFTQIFVESGELVEKFKCGNARTQHVVLLSLHFPFKEGR